MSSSGIPRYPSMPVLYTRGSFYDVGYNVGVTFGQNIRRFWAESTNIQTIDDPFNRTAEGKEFYDKTLAVCKEAYPQYIRELEGMADGAGMEFRQLFLLNISREVELVLAHQTWTSLDDPEKTTPSPVKEVSEMAGCSDVLINSPDCKIMAHNEDWDAEIKPFGYIVKVCIVNEDGEEVENFTSYCYPGSLPGTTMGWNAHGLVFTLNALYTDYVAYGAPARNFVCRATLRAKTPEEVIQLLKNQGYGTAFGMNVNLADINKLDKIVSIEMAPQTQESQLSIFELPEQETKGPTPCHYLHFNNYQHLPNMKPPNMKSSPRRALKADSLPAPTCRAKALRILGDDSDQEYPIFRSCRDTDPHETIFTSVFDLIAKRVDFYQGNPSLQSTKCFMSFPL